ncbi:MAG: hypothetical protein HY905_06640 [Deltaproteobacteria bacterium]|nr:hypothetical protein [Deltaproteobacteria bacterium]
MTGMTLGEAVRNAVEVELAAGRFYDGLVDRARTSEVRRVLESLAGQEFRHARAVRSVGMLLASGELAAPDDGPLDLVETAPAWMFVEDIGLPEALQVAFEAETHAYIYYDALVDVTSGSLQGFFRQLKGREEEHVRDVARLIALVGGKVRV